MPPVSHQRILPSCIQFTKPGVGFLNQGRIITLIDRLLEFLLFFSRNPAEVSLGCNSSCPFGFYSPLWMPPLPRPIPM